jgi:hypothetical protein
MEFSSAMTAAGVTNLNVRRNPRAVGRVDVGRMLRGKFDELGDRHVQALLADRSPDLRVRMEASVSVAASPWTTR